jgi:hypothetical protein
MSFGYLATAWATHFKQIDAFKQAGKVEARRAESPFGESNGNQAAGKGIGESESSVS